MVVKNDLTNKTGSHNRRPGPLIATLTTDLGHIVVHTSPSFFRCWLQNFVSFFYFHYGTFIGPN